MDPRIIQYRQAVLAMKDGRSDVLISLEPDDEIAQLGKALIELNCAIAKRFDEIRTLVRVTEKINAGLVLDEVLQQVYDGFHSIIPYDRIGFSLLEDDGATVCACWARSAASEAMIHAGYRAPLKGSSLEQIIATGQPRILNDLEAYLREHPNSEPTRLIVQEGMRSSLTCPLIAAGKPVGFIFFSSMKPNTYQNVHVELFQEIAGLLAMIVEKGRLYQQLVELNDLKNKFLGIAAHDLRNPIAVIKSNAALLLGNYLGPLSDRHRKVLETINRTCQTMLALIDDLLDISAIESGRLELNCRETDLAEFLRECYESNRILGQSKNIELHLVLEPNLPRVCMDPNRIAQVVNNLITNAFKFSHPQTAVTLRARTCNGEVEISVADQGQGIPPEDLPKMFQHFSRTSVRPTAGEKSTGLGLAIVKRMVEAHGGRVWVESCVGLGSTFFFTLPVASIPDEKQSQS
ncbi:MAG: GAF domain-containing sensor histidine kinase [Candidatus Sumerlaeia bacterium]|nr:GAF domain-containing sensor histidine kinase [Candidatus Sumerlaeia bacterium]